MDGRTNSQLDGLKASIIIWPFFTQGPLWPGPVLRLELGHPAWHSSIYICDLDQAWIRITSYLSKRVICLPLKHSSKSHASSFRTLTMTSRVTHNGMRIKICGLSGILHLHSAVPAGILSGELPRQFQPALLQSRAASGRCSCSTARHLTLPGASKALEPQDL